MWHVTSEEISRHQKIVLKKLQVLGSRSWRLYVLLSFRLRCAGKLQVMDVIGIVYKVIMN